MFHVKQAGSGGWGRGLLAAFMLCATAAAAQDGQLSVGEPPQAPLSAGEVRLSASGLTLRGRVLGFDGRFLRIETAEGELTVDSQAVGCEGSACPAPEGFVPELRLSGDAGLGTGLLPPPIEGFAAAQGWTVEQDGERYILREGGTEMLRIGLRLTTTEDGVADLLVSEADLAVMGHAPLPQEEEELLAEAALGGAGELRLRLLGQSALVPVTGAGQRVARMTIEDLARIYAGEVPSWSELGGEDQPIRPHLGPGGSASARSFVADVLGPTGQVLSPGVVRHPDEASVAAAVAADPQAIGVLPFRATGDAQPMALVGRCGLPWVPRPEAVRMGDYPLTIPLALLQPMRRLPPSAQAFVDFLATPETQLVLRRAGLEGAGAVPIPWASQGERLAAAIHAAGPEVPLRELQRLIRVLGPFTRLSTTFRFTSGTRLDAESRGHVLRLAHDIADGRYAGRTLLLAGFSDGRGPAEENRALSMARARAVEAEILDALGGGLPADMRLRVHAFGEALPMGCDGELDGPWGSEVNRRVELWVSG